VSAKNTRSLAAPESSRKGRENNPQQVVDEIFPRGARFSDMIGVTEMPQISNLDSTKTAKTHDPSLFTARASSAS
jgi:hypothetical protein